MIKRLYFYSVTFFIISKYFYMMKSKNRAISGNGIAIGSAIGLALGYAFAHNSSNTMKYIAMGLAIGAGFGAIIDFLNRPK